MIKTLIVAESIENCEKLVTLTVSYEDNIENVKAIVKSILLVVIANKLESEEELLEIKEIEENYNPYKNKIGIIKLKILDSAEIYDNWIDRESFRYGV